MQSSRGNLAVILSCLLVAAVIEVELPAGSAPSAPMVPARLASLPYQLGRFTGREAHAASVEGFAGEIHRIYQTQGNSLELLAFPAPLNQHGPEDCLPYRGWSIIARQRGDLPANPAIELQTILALPGNSSARPLACGYYWRQNNSAGSSLLISWLQQRWATVTQSEQPTELVTICTGVDDVRRPQPALERIYEFANDLEPYFHAPQPRVLESRAWPLNSR